MKEADLNGVKYIGADLVPELVEKNNENYKNKDREFKVLDLIEDELPLVDMIICPNFVSLRSTDAIQDLLRRSL